MSVPPEEPPTDVASLPPAVVLDTSVVSALGRPDNSKYLAFAEVFDEAETVGHIPPCVMEELTHGTGRTYGAHTTVYHGTREGWMQRGPPFDGGGQYANGPTASSVSDSIRERMADKYSVEEHEVEKVDTLLPGIAIQLLGNDNDRTGVVVKDKDAANAAYTVLRDTPYEDLIRIYRGKPFIEFATERSERSPNRGIY